MKKTRKYRLTERFYKIMFTIGCAVILATGIAKTEAKEHKLSELHTFYYKVESSDSLWSIAKINCPKDLDIRDYIEEIKMLNNINSDIYENQTLKILI